jgi:hypothetical protein
MRSQKYSFPLYGDKQGWNLEVPQKKIWNAELDLKDPLKH